MKSAMRRIAAVAVMCLCLSGCSLWERLTVPSCYEGDQASAERCRDDAQPEYLGWWSIRQVRVDGRDIYYAITNYAFRVSPTSELDKLNAPLDHYEVQRVSRYTDIDIVEVNASAECRAPGMMTFGIGIFSTDGCLLEPLGPWEFKDATAEVAAQVLSPEDLEQLTQRAESAGRKIAFRLGIQDQRLSLR